MLAITGTRRGEVTTLVTAAVHVESRALSLADTKTGQSVRPAGSVAVAFLQALAPLANRGMVLPSARGGDGPYGGLPRAWNEIRAAEPAFAGVTLRDLRRSFSSVGDELGLTVPTIAALLGHAGSSITERYIVKPDAAVQAAADLVADEVLRRLGISKAELRSMARRRA